MSDAHVRESPVMPLVAVIGVGPGGTAPLEEIMRATRQRAGLVWVVVGHANAAAAPEALAARLHEASGLRAAVLRDAQPLVAGQVHVLRPGRSATYDPQVGCLVEEAAPEEAPIDRAFHALSPLGNRLVAVLLTGTGVDGNLGMSIVAAAGGATLAAPPVAPLEAHAVGLEVVRAGFADPVRSPTEVAAELDDYVLQQQATGKRETEVAAAIPAVTELLRRRIDHDFRQYKPATLERRIRRRMQVLRLATASDYVDRLEQESAEAEALFRELLIGVTAFFRDPEAFEFLASTVLPELLARNADELRIWVPGCSTGEEAYSLAILLREQLEGRPRPPEVRIFATDLDVRSLEIARRGTYPERIEQEISPQRLQRFFDRRARSYKVKPELRTMCSFAPHNLISDPPFSRIDLLSCRNVLIYLGPHLQKKLIPVFHYALRPNGYLFLGPSEDIASHGELFRSVSPRFRVAQRKAVLIPFEPPVRAEPRSSAASGAESETPEPDLSLIMQRVVLDEFAPKSVIVDAEGRIRCASSDMSPFLTVGGGTFHNNVIRLARDGLSPTLRALLHEVLRTRRRAVREDAVMRIGDHGRRVRLTVQPMPQLGEGDLMLVVFEDHGKVAAVGSELALEHHTAAAVRQLEHELAATRDDLERSVQDLESANEELKSSNEELLSMNEELQSANEELEARRDEVDQINRAMAAARDDLENLLRSTGIATVFLDDDQVIRSFTPAMTAIFNLVGSDVGRPLWHVTHRAESMPPLPSPETVDGDGAQEPVRTTDGRSFLRRVLPYRRLDGTRDGIVVTFTDITDQRQIEDALRVIEERYREATLAADVGTWRVDLETGLDTRDASLSRILGLPPEERTEPMEHFFAFVHPEDRERCEKALQDAITGNGFYDTENRIVRPDGEVRWIRDRGRVLRDPQGRPRWVTGAVADITERKEAELRLRAAEEQRRAALHSAEMGTWDIELTTERLHADERCARMLGISQGTEVSLAEAAERVHPDDRARVQEAVETALRGEHDGAYDVEYRIIPSPGTIHWVRAVGQVWFEREGPARRAHRFLGVVMDTTAARENEERTRISEERYRRLVEVTADVVWTTDPDGRLASPQPALEAFTGRRTEELEGWQWLDVVHPDHRVHVHEAWTRALTTHAPLTVEARVWRADAQEHCWVELRAVPLLTRSNRIREWVALLRDVHQVREAHRALEASQERLSLAIEATRLGWFEWDPNTREHVWSARAREFFALREDELNSASILGRIAEEDRERVQAGIGGALEPDGPGEYVEEYRIRGPFGERVISARGRTTFAGDGSQRRALKMTGTFVDVTQAHRAAEALREAARHKDQFLAMLGHELRNPLAAISNAVELQRLVALEEPTIVRSREIIARQTAHMKRLIDDLLDVARIVRGRMQLQRTAFDLVELLRDVVEDHRAGCEARNLRLTFDLPADVRRVPVLADAARLAQVLSNLLDNSCKYTSGPGTVAVAVALEAAYVMVSVSDTGRGMSREELELVFEPFRQVASDVGPARGDSGLGLGLALVRGLVELHGGHVSGHSDGLGRGSTFRLYLPLPDPKTLAGFEEPVEREPEIHRIVVIEDNVDSAEMLREVLSRSGHHVELAHDGEEGVQVVHAFQPTVVLCDIGLPGGMSGYDVARRLRTELADQCPYLVAVTGFATASDREEALEAGFDAHLAKPMSLEEAAKILAQASRG